LLKPQQSFLDNIFGFREASQIPVRERQETLAHYGRSKVLVRDAAVLETGTVQTSAYK
jgi:hypothetical protein